MTLVHPVTGTPLKLGRIRPKVKSPRLKFGNYMLRKLPDPAIECDYTSAAMPALSQLYGNDQWGDCVIAWILHFCGLSTSIANGTPKLFTLADAAWLYNKIGGFVEGDESTDNGCDEQTALHWWTQKGVNAAGDHKIIGEMSVDATDPIEVRQVISTFGNVMIGAELPDACISSGGMKAGAVWDACGAPNPQNGHCVGAPGLYKKGQIGISTWGQIEWATDAWIAEYCTAANGGELYTVITQEMVSVATQKSPIGIDWTQMAADFQALGGQMSLTA